MSPCPYPHVGLGGLDNSSSSEGARRCAAGENTDDLQPVNLRLWVACGRCKRKPL